LHTEKDFPGTGIGLSIASKAAEKHGWKIDAESATGKGAKFHLRIPQKDLSA
jgi:signal transduction histidine kinase